MAPHRRRSALLLSAALLTFAALGFEPAVLRNQVVEGSGYRVTIGAIKAPVWSAAWAQTSPRISLENVTITLGPATYTAKRIDFSGVASTRAELEALFDQGSTVPLADRLAKVTADQVSIPELTAEYGLGGVRTRASYRNVVGTDLRDGRVRTIITETSSQETSGPKGRSISTTGRSTAEDTDLAALARIYTEKAGPEAAPLTKVLGSFTSEDMTADTGTGFIMRIGRTSGRDFYARPMQDSWVGLVAMADSGELFAESKNRLFAVIADIWGAFELGQVELVDITFNGPLEKGDASARIARLAYSGAAAGRPADARLESFEVRTKEGSAKIGALAFTGFSFQSTIEGLRALSGKSIEEIDRASLRRLVPTLGTVTISGLDFDVPQDEPKRPNTENIRLTLKDLELTADAPVNGIPTNVRFVMRNLSTPLRPDSKKDGIKALLGLGYKAVDLSLSAAAKWDEGAGELAVSEVSAHGAEMGKVTLRGTLGGITKEVFDPDGTVAMVALMGAAAKSIDLTVENAGLFDRHLRQEAGKQKKTVESLRREYGTAASLAIPLMLGSSPQAKTLGQAIARFIANPTRLTVMARAKNPTGLGLANVIGSDPATILEKLDVTAGTDQPL